MRSFLTAASARQTEPESSASSSSSTPRLSFEETKQKRAEHEVALRNARTLVEATEIVATGFITPTGNYGWLNETLGVVRTNFTPTSKGRKMVPQRVLFVQKRTSSAKNACTAYNNGNIQFVASDDVTVPNDAVCTLPDCFRSVSAPYVTFGMSSILFF
jgi:hypothetical protein